jgi:glycolate oxidase FAD binding subunit
MIEAHTANSAPDADCSEQIRSAVLQAHAEHMPLYLSGGDSKEHWLGRTQEAARLDVSSHRGIVDYQPSELVMTARGGTPLTTIVTTLAANNQCLPFEPPLFDGKATLGGTLACNLSGPCRPWRGSIRDAVLGVQLINGKGECLNFGGKVMKNVAGYDVSRLQAGALGTLGVLSEISVKVLPAPETTVTLAFELTQAQALEQMNRRAREPKPLTGACWLEGRMYLRLSGAASAVDATARLWGGEIIASGDAFWQDLCDFRLPFFADAAPLCRFSISATAPPMPAFDTTLIDWCGAQRWVYSAQPIDQLHADALTGGGHVMIFRGGPRNGEVRSPLTTVEQHLQQRLKRAFDPRGILNPGRMYSWL